MKFQAANNSPMSLNSMNCRFDTTYFLKEQGFLRAHLLSVDKENRCKINRETVKGDLKSCKKEKPKGPDNITRRFWHYYMYY